MVEGVRCRRSPPGGARPQDGAKTHRVWPGAGAVRPVSAAGEQARAFSRCLCERLAAPAIDRAPSAPRTVRPRPHGRLQHSHRLPARYQADRAGALRDAIRPPGAGPTSCTSARCSQTGQGESGSSGCSRWCSATAECCGPTSYCTRTCRPCCAVTPPRSRPLAACPEHILYDRMRTVVSREEPEAGHIASTTGPEKSWPIGQELRHSKIDQLSARR
jgi:hypothetical protein